MDQFFGKLKITSLSEEEIKKLLDEYFEEMDKAND